MKQRAPLSESGLGAQSESPIQGTFSDTQEEKDVLLSMLQLVDDISTQLPQGPVSPYPKHEGV